MKHVETDEEKQVTILFLYAIPTGNKIQNFSSHSPCNKTWYFSGILFGIVYMDNEQRT